MPHQHHHLISRILHLIAGGSMGVVTASLAHHFGARSAERMPGESRAPQCFYCLKPLSWQEIFPLFSWLLRPDTLSFPCPCGLRKNLWTQPAAEILGLLLGVSGMLLLGWSPMAVPLCLGLGLLPAIAIIDLEFGIIPDGLNFLLGLLGFWWVIANGEDMPLAFITSGSLLAIGLFLALGYSRLRGREMLGLGDVKFFAAAGLWIPLMIASYFLALAGFIGAAGGLITQRLGGGKEFPFAPALCLALAACILFHIVQLP